VYAQYGKAGYEHGTKNYSKIFIFQPILEFQKHFH
jgi:hypothetical protein